MNSYFISTAGVFLFFLAIGAFLNALGTVATPFIIGMIFAYFLNPLKEKIDKRGFKSISPIIVTVLFISAFLLFSVTILPVLAKQFVILGAKISANSESIKIFFLDIFNNIKEMFPDLGEKVEEFITKFSGSILSIASGVIFKALHSGAAAVNIISIVLISPIALYYMLKDWSKISKTVTDMIPVRMKKDALILMKRIDVTLSGYIKGQTYVCTTLGIFYAITFTLIGLESGVVLGALTGLLVFIPYLGAIFSFFLCTLVAILQFGSLQPVILVGGAIVVAQAVESNFLTPYFIGKNIGLSPLWIIFSILAGGVLFGFIGVLFALPLTAILGVVIKFGFEKYRNSNFYKS